MLQTKRADFNGIAARFHISPVTARIIRNRDVEGETAIDRYLNGTLDQLYDPHLMKDMDKAACSDSGKDPGGRRGSALWVITISTGCAPPIFCTGA